MRSVGIKALKNRLSEYVKIAASGETVLICDRDRVVAEIHPPEAGRAEAPADAALAALIREGVLALPIDKKSPLPERRPIAKLKLVLKALDASREG